MTKSDDRKVVGSNLALNKMLYFFFSKYKDVTVYSGRPDVEIKSKT